MNFLKKDLKEEARILRRRQNEEERAKRIFHPRARLFGVDLNELDKQILEKRKREEAERQENEVYEAKIKERESQWQEMEKAVKNQRKDLEKRLVEFREVNQKPWCRREYDLNDPEALKKSVETSIVSKFEGYDEACRKRQELQKTEYKSWLIQQMAEKKKIKQQEEANDEKITNHQLELQLKSFNIGEVEKEYQKKLEEATAEYNKMLAQEKALKSQEEAKEQAKIEAQEVENWMNGDLLTENPATANSALGPGRIIAYKYKGQTPAQIAQLKQEQLNQAREQKLRESQNLRDQEKWEKYETLIDCNAKEKRNDFVKDQRKLEKELSNINAHLAEEQKQREMINNSKYDLQPMPLFFDQFNRSSY